MKREELFSTEWARDILAGLNRKGKHVYGLTVPDDVKQQRRAKNKVARKSRRQNRG
ncbi:hypothetical protein [Nocardia niwae]|uniref:hypothetical protein n=1 Tax=Nocardia niwae TaxID=626084 RepID=UPI000B0C7663|nr:hypothetical protein [Nocardia niwae]